MDNRDDGLNNLLEGIDKHIEKLTNMADEMKVFGAEENNPPVSKAGEIVRLIAAAMESPVYLQELHDMAKLLAHKQIMDKVSQKTMDLIRKDVEEYDEPNN